MINLKLESVEINLHKGINGMHRLAFPNELQVPMNDDDVILLRNALNELLPKEKQFPQNIYVYRNYPCNIVPDDQLWCVCGGLVDSAGKAMGGGVLEWCTNEEDANNILNKMKDAKTSDNLRFVNLSAEKYNQ